MFKREIKVNFKSFLIWGISLGLLLVLIFAIYPSISDKIEFDDMMKNFPPELLKSFNFDVVSISTVFGWYASEGFTIVSLIVAMYAAVLGASIVLKEESDKTIEFLYSKPVSRGKILLSKLLAGVVYVIAFNIFIMIITGIGFALSDDMHVVKWLLLTLSPILIGLATFVISAFISLFFKKTRKAMGVALGIVMGTYVVNMIAKMSDNVDFLKYLTPFGYIDSADIVTNSALPLYSIIIVLIIIVFAGLLWFRYDRKEFL